MTLHVDIITPEKLVYSDEADFVAAPASDGEIGILPHHTPLLTRLGFGELRIRKGSEIKHLAISGGFLEVQDGAHVSIFAETAEMAGDINTERARLAAERARAQLEAPGKLKDLDLSAAEASLNKALLRLKVANRVQRRRSPDQIH